MIPHTGVGLPVRYRITAPANRSCCLSAPSRRHGLASATKASDRPLGSHVPRGTRVRRPAALQPRSCHTRSTTRSWHGPEHGVPQHLATPPCISACRAFGTQADRDTIMPSWRWRYEPGLGPEWRPGSGRPTLRQRRESILTSTSGLDKPFV